MIRRTIQRLVESEYATSFGIISPDGQDHSGTRTDTNWFPHHEIFQKLKKTHGLKHSDELYQKPFVRYQFYHNSNNLSGEIGNHETAKRNFKDLAARLRPSHIQLDIRSDQKTVQRIFKSAEELESNL